MDLSLLNGPNVNANEGRRNALANLASGAANLIGQGNDAAAINKLTTLLHRIDSDPTVPDWMNDSTEKTSLFEGVSLLISLLQA